MGKHFSERSEPSHFFLSKPLSAHCARPSPHSASFTQYVFFLPFVLPRPPSAHYARPSPRPHTARSSRGFLLQAQLTLLTAVHRPCVVFPYEYFVMCRILELFSIDVQLISKVAFLHLALTSFANLMQT